jgi:cytochrome P450
MPILDKFMRKNPLYLLFNKPTSFFVANSQRLVKERLADEKHEGVDLLDGFLESQKKHPQIVDQGVLSMYIGTNFLAGSDTTGVTIRSIIYYTLRTPGVLEKLRKELDESIAAYPPDYHSAMSLKYLDAVIREGMRMHPVASFLMERVVPSGGHTTVQSGTHIPAGAILSVTQWGLNFDEAVWGPEPRKFRPERWLPFEGESDESYQKRFAQMKHDDLNFSLGPRVCLGKHIAWLEMVELLPTLFGVLDVSEHPSLILQL